MLIDVRGPRFSAWVTSAVLAIALLTASGVLVAVQAAEAPARFAQLVGFLFAVVGAAGFLLGAPTVGFVATGLALVAALLNAATGFCLGCELYLTARRALPART